MKLLVLCLSLVAVTIASPTPKDDDTQQLVETLNTELEDIIKLTELVNSMKATELRKLTDRVDGTMRQLEDFAEKRLGLNFENVESLRNNRQRRDDDYSYSPDSSNDNSLSSGISEDKYPLPGLPFENTWEDESEK